VAAPASPEPAAEGPAFPEAPPEVMEFPEPPLAIPATPLPAAGTVDAPADPPGSPMPCEPDLPEQARNTPRESHTTPQRMRGLYAGSLRCLPWEVPSLSTIDGTTEA
jgi:hypothetical protein